MPHILVIQLARFGDLIQTKRLILSLAAIPENRVHLCVDHSLAGLAQAVYPFATLHPIHAHAGGVAESRILAENNASFTEMAGKDFAEVYNLNYSGLNFSVSALFAPEKVRGYSWRKGQQLKDRWPAMAFRWTRDRGPSPLNLADFWAHLTPRPIGPETVNPEARAHGKGIGVVLAGRHARRSLPTETLARVVTASAEKYDPKRIFLLGSKTERAAGSALKRAISAKLVDKVENLAGNTDWRGLLDALTGLDLVITPDTGTMHLAAHVGAPILALFLSSAWAWETGPYGLGHQVWQARVPCGPCNESDPCGHDLECLAPFGQGPFLRGLTGKEGGEPPNSLLGLYTEFDELGVRYTPFVGEDPHGEERNAGRALLARFLGAHLAQPPALERENRLAAKLFRDRDWMTRDRHAVSGLE